MRVRARQQGFYGKLREKGEVFDVKEEKAVSSIWMERLDGPEPVKAAAVVPVRVAPAVPIQEYKVPDIERVAEQQPATFVAEKRSPGRPRKQVAT